MKIYLQHNKTVAPQVPSQANETDAGYDVIATSSPVIVGDFIERPLDGLKIYKNVAYIEYHTNLFIAPEDKGTHTELYPRSSISKQNILLCNSIGLIDNGYRGEILFRFKYIFQPEDLFVIPEMGMYKVYGMVNPDRIYQAGAKIGQIVGKTTQHIEFEKVESLAFDTARGASGFGASGV